MRSSLLFLYRYMTKKHWFLLGYFALILESVTPVMALLYQRDLIDRVFIKGQHDAFTWLLSLYAIFFFAPKVWFTVRKVCFFHLSYHLQMNLNTQFLNKVYEMPAEKFNQASSAKLLNTIRNDISDASDVALNQILSELVMVLLSVLLLSLAIARISLTMLGVAALVAIVYYVLLHTFSGKTKALAHKIRQEKANVSETVEESIAATREIVGYNRQNWQMTRYESRYKALQQATFKEGLYKAKIILLSEPLLYGAKLSVILIGGLHVIESGTSLGAFVVSFTLVDQLVSVLGQAFQLALTAKRLTAPVKKIQDILLESSEKVGDIKWGQGPTSLVFKKVSFCYSEGSDPILSQLDMVIPLGKKVAFVGASGSGKSTIGHLLLRRYAPKSGEILMDGMPIEHFSQSYTQGVSVVFQTPHFLPISIRENLCMGKAYSEAQILEVCEKLQCKELVENQFETELGERGANLSGGQKQRLALARALLKNTEILILDEATSALDTETEFKVQQSIDQMRKGKTTLVIAHRLTTILNADLIFVIDKGRVAASGRHEALMASSDIYQKLYTAELA